MSGRSPRPIVRYRTAATVRNPRRRNAQRPHVEPDRCACSRHARNFGGDGSRLGPPVLRSAPGAPSASLPSRWHGEASNTASCSTGLRFACSVCGCAQYRSSAIVSYAIEPWAFIRGYGIRGIGSTRAYVWCNKVVHIKTTNGDVYLGHNDPARIVRDLDRMMGVATKG